MAGDGGSLLHSLNDLSDAQRTAFLAGLSEDDLAVMASDFASARETQVAPDGP